MKIRNVLLALFGLTATVVPVAGLQLLDAAPAAAAATPLVGVFTITPGACNGGVISGTYLRMVLSGGTNAAGPYFSNSDSSCSDNTYTPLAPGRSGGLSTEAYQPEPSPAFDGSGNALANSITAPVPFEGVRFATATNSTDPQTGLHAPVPSIVANGSALSGSVQAFGVSWNKQEFNQGSPKPDGTTPGNTTAVTGTYDAATGNYVLQWSSQVVGGPFNGFSAYWNLTGRFVPAAGRATPAPATPSGIPAASSGAPGSTAPNAGAVGVTHPTGTSPTSASQAAPTLGASSATTTTPATSGGSASTSALKETRVVLSSHTIITGGGGWQAPTWLIVVVAALALAGLGGILLSERALRQLRTAVSD